MSAERDGVGKIERLPWELREQVCRRLRDGETGAKICKWLNALPEVLTVLDEHFGEQPISAQNLSAFKLNGYQKWLARQARIDRTRELASYSMEIAKSSGGNLSDGAAQLLSGQILEVLEQLESVRTASADFTDSTETGKSADDRFTLIAESLGSLTLSISRLRKGDQNAEALRQREKQLDHQAESLRIEREKWDQKLAEIAEQKRRIESAVQTVRSGGLTPAALKAIEEAAALL